MFWEAIILLWTIIDFVRYIYYCRTYRELNKPVKKSIGKNNGVDNFLNDIRKYPEMFMENLDDIFYHKVKPENMNYNDVCDAIYFLVNKNDDYVDDIKHNVKRIQLHYRKKHNRNIFVGINHHKFIKFGHTDIKSWFFILPLYIITKLFGLFIQYYAKYLGYKSYIYPNKLRIWYSDYDSKKGNPTIYMHSSVGGISFIYMLLKHYIVNTNIIIPEIPGISFVEMNTKPPPIQEITDTINSFIETIYIKNIDIDTRFNLIGHSLGNTICISYINKYPKQIDRYYCIEGLLFTQRILKYYVDIEKPLITLPFHQISTIPIFYRNMYVQYSLTRLLSIEHCFLYNSDTTKNIKIIVFHSKSDDRILIEPQLKYARTKNIPISYHIFTKNLIHGSFILNKNMREYILQEIFKKSYK